MPRETDGKLTLDEMRAVIEEEGGSVLHNGRHITTVDELPDESELVGDDPDKLETLLQRTQRERADLQKRERALARQLAELEAKHEELDKREAEKSTEGGVVSTAEPGTPNPELPDDPDLTGGTNRTGEDPEHTEEDDEDGPVDTAKPVRTATKAAKAVAKAK